MKNSEGYTFLLIIKVSESQKAGVTEKGTGLKTWVEFLVSNFITILRCYAA